ncbi:MAG: ammonium transporter [Gammaproteobacteria bacterium]|nr:ammonium transporter [Gammaproteobacteria bacterium]NIR98229.1 ammonium transporter [Gammaproteobacteria bacterium]NIT63900.1 ammonium transporter [Gammaproteobacteria bacterium]NIV20904.1 ammonium transporter [Gammaproteobacteria bacterium]NIY32480.1 ammonium transporter [Gammaproteobacteria bacterium]
MRSEKITGPTSLAAAALLAAIPSVALAEDTLNAGDTAWMLTATALVLFMTIPGLSLFYAGMVRSKNVLSVLMQCFAITALMTVLWALYGYSIAFGGEGAYWGGLAKVFLKGVGVSSVSGTIPETVFMTFQMTFAIITPALIVGAFAERMKFSAMLWFMAVWLTVVYAPITHWVWGDGGWLGGKGILDFAGGTVVHINAGIAGLVAALVLGKRNGYPTTMMPPHNLGYTVVGASMLWVGWFGFNAGSELAADGTAGMAMAVTQIATAAAALGWMFSEWATHGKPSVLGIASGAVAGLVAITPASGSVGPMGALAIGIAAGIGCFLAATRLKRALGYDDSLDVFGVHAVGGIIGAVLTGVFCAPALGGAGFGEGIGGIGGQVGVQLIGVVATIVYTGVVSLVILKVLDAIIGLRVSEEHETEGLDLALHDERGYIL